MSPAPYKLVIVLRTSPYSWIAWLVGRRLRATVNSAPLQLSRGPCAASSASSAPQRPSNASAAASPASCRPHRHPTTRTATPTPRNTPRRGRRAGASAWCQSPPNSRRRNAERSRQGELISYRPSARAVDAFVAPWHTASVRDFEPTARPVALAVGSFEPAAAVPVQQPTPTSPVRNPWGATHSVHCCRSHRPNAPQTGQRRH